MIKCVFTQCTLGGTSMQKLRKPVSVLLALLMVFTVFTVVPVSAASASAGTIEEGVTYQLVGIVQNGKDDS